MSPSRPYALILIICIRFIYGQDITKSSLTFILDDTSSMEDDINDVKNYVNTIFETVATSKESPIENFVLVTFNDNTSYSSTGPDARLLTVTKDRNEFKSALASIKVHGGYDCPELCMRGIEIALENSLPYSLFYVFTDAPAKDYDKYEKIRSLALKKSIQITFLLTNSDCWGVESNPDYQVYPKLADSTGGEIFNMMKDEVPQFLNYVNQSINSAKEVLFSAKFPPGLNKFNITVDSKTSDVVVSASGEVSYISVKNPDLKKADLESIVDTDKKKIVKLRENKPGVHEAEIDSKTDAKVKVTGSTSVKFQPGFSSFLPITLEDTDSRPEPDGNAYLSIKIIGDGVTFETAKILDVDHNVIQELPLRFINKEFYVTDLFDPPRTMFHIEIHGYDDNDKTPIKRVTTTPIERKNSKYETSVENVAPTVKIQNEPQIISDSNAQLQLKCQVHGYPKPRIIWQENGTEVELPAKVETVERPYDYISILNIVASQNKTYACQAINPQGVDMKHIEVGVHAQPPPIITWYKDEKILSRNDDKTTVTIKHVNLETQGKYICLARSNNNYQLFISNVYVQGLALPMINKTDDVIEVIKGNDAYFTCQVIEGAPEPDIRWIYISENTYKYEELNATGADLHLQHVSNVDAGTYICNASNVLGFDLYAVDLLVEYPPEIKNATFEKIQAKDGDVVILHCDVEAYPRAEVLWLKNESILTNQDNIYMSRNNRLLFREIMVSDSGFYTCMASNKLGVSNKTTYVDVIVPVKIEIPKITTIEALVGQSFDLPCIADGYPRPEIQWMYNDFEGINPPKILPENTNETSLRLVRIQTKDQGYYTCAANNTGGSVYLTYDVNVNAPPVIENIYPDKTFRVVSGDLALVIHCNATGSPTPSIVWKRNDLNIPAGTKWYDMKNGTLIIKNIEKKLEGSYLCLAENKLGSDSIVYDVVVRETEFPYDTRRIPIKYIEENQTVTIGCDIPHKRTDLLRWYKDSRFIKKGELILNNVNTYDEGIYSCRVSNEFSKSLSTHMQLKLGSRPVFNNDEQVLIDFVLDDDVALSCDATAYPEPTVYWTYNGEKLPETGMNYHLHMTLNKRGYYACTVSNVLGSIQRNFSIITQDCIFDSRKEFLGAKKPLMLSQFWPMFDIIDGYTVIGKTELFYLYCPKGFAEFPTKYLKRVFCEGGSRVKIDGIVYEYSHIKCKEEPELTIKNTGEKCLSGNTELIQVGYDFFEFLNVFEVCLNMDNNLTLYTKHAVFYDHYKEIDNAPTEWTQNGLTTIDFESIYDCKNQGNEIKSALKTNSTYNGCCYDRRFLVNPIDFSIGVPIAAAYTYLNTVPHWSTCNSKNWDKVEEKIRELAENYDNELLVTTGTGKPWSTYEKPKDIVFNDKQGNSVYVPQYIWKIVKDPVSSKSVVIIQLNVPYLTPEDASKYVHCRDICHEIKWMAGVDWKNVEDGFTYCCSIKSFEEAFNYRDQFSNEITDVLDSEITPKYHYSI